MKKVFFLSFVCCLGLFSCVDSFMYSDDSITPQHNDTLLEKGFSKNRGHKGRREKRGDEGRHGSCGITGRHGIEGPFGPQGEQGKKGHRGLRGVQGLFGPKGPKGDKGAPGPQGATGVTGEQGEEGQQGSPGPQGPTGFQGIQGEGGDKGPQGTGFQGPTGPMGNPTPLLSAAAQCEQEITIIPQTISFTYPTSGTQRSDFLLNINDGTPLSPNTSTYFDTTTHSFSIPSGSEGDYLVSSALIAGVSQTIVDHFTHTSMYLKVRVISSNMTQTDYGAVPLTLSINNLINVGALTANYFLTGIGNTIIHLNSQDTVYLYLFVNRYGIGTAGVSGTITINPLLTNLLPNNPRAGSPSNNGASLYLIKLPPQS